MKLPANNDWLVKAKSFLIGEFIFMLIYSDWMAKKQLDVNSINHFYKIKTKHFNQNFKFHPNSMI